MKNIKIKYKYVLLIIASILFIIGSIAGIKSIIQSRETTKQNEIIRDISFMPYSNEKNLIVLVTIEDSEYGINTVTYKDKNDKDIRINANSKKKVGIDYEIDKDGEYTFTAHNGNGQTIEKTLVIDTNNKENDTFGNLIDIKIDNIIDEGRTVPVKADVSITYNYGFGADYYKIGNQQSWNQYNDTFRINSYDILSNSWQESDSRTITIYAKRQDDRNNKIIITKQTTDLDLDMATAPVISVLSRANYPTLTNYGVKLHSNVAINYDTRNDITNYYSLNKGNTWEEYNGEISGYTNFYMWAKSVKNDSGLEIISKITINPAAGNALGVQAYDNDNGTSAWIPSSGKRLDIDSSMQGKTVYFYMYMSGSNGSGATLRVYNTDGSSTVLYSRPSWGGMTVNENKSIPSNASYFWFENRKDFSVYEIRPPWNPVINETKHYPAIATTGVIEGYSTATVSYYDTSEQKLYKIDDEEWKEYSGETIRFEIGQTLYVKGIDQYGTETPTISRKSELPSDLLGEKAYNDNPNDYEVIPTTWAQRKIYIDDSLKGKKIHLKMNMYGSNNNIISRLTLYKEDGSSYTFLEKPSWGNMWIDGDYTLPSDALYFAFAGNTSAFTVYDIRAAESE